MEFFSNLTALIYNAWSVATTPEDAAMHTTPPFGAEEWKRHFNMDVTPPAIPDALLSTLETPSPFWKNHLVKETHFLCLIPGKLTAEEFWKKSNSHRAPVYLKDLPSREDTYWILITKQTLPHSRDKSYKDQKEEVAQHGYRLPTALEALVAVSALKHFANLSIFPTRGAYTRCQEEVGEWPLAIGSDPSGQACCMTNDWNSRNGVAAVLEIPS